jgi:ABC-2 type transport system ATP-binding protein
VEAAVTARNLTRDFGTIRAVGGLDLEVQRGQIYGLVGPDGAGKTTTIRMLVGVLDPTAGSASVAGTDLGLIDTVRDRIGYMSQRFGLYEDLTVMENLRFFAQLQDLPSSHWLPRAQRFLDMTGLSSFTDRLAGHLSGGMKQKLGLSCAMLHTPEVLFLDEPTAGVDPVSRRDFWQLLYELLQEGVTILLSTSYLDEAERCSRLGFLHRGRLLAEDTPDRIRTSATTSHGGVTTLEEAFTRMVQDSDAT